MHSDFGNIRGKRICFVGDFRNYPEIAGGAEKQTRILACELQNLGAEVFFISPSATVRSTIIKGIQISTYLRSKTLSFLGQRYLLAGPRVKGMLLSISPHLIFQRGLSALTRTCSKYARQRGIPFFFSVSSDNDLLANRLRFRLRYPIFTLEEIFGRRGIRQATQIMAQTKAQQKILLTSYGRESHLIRNFFLPALDQPAAERQDAVLWVGKSNLNKGPEAILRVAEKSPMYTFYLAGLEKLPDLSIRRSRLSIIPGNVKVLGPVPNDELLSYMATCKVFCSTSLWEGLPNVFVEAWAQKCAIVSLNINPDGFLDHDRCGIFCRGEIERAAASIRRLIEDDEFRGSIADRGYDLFRTEFGYQLNMDKALSFISGHL
jgi:glycosyltransferase involved in cell wall biosynthesis